MASIPSTQLGVLSTKTSVTLQEFPVPSPGPHEVLIQNVAVASNPKDWKVPQWVESYSAIEGNDVAGIIVKVGEGVTEYKGGERVAAFTKMGTQDNKVCTFSHNHNFKCLANIPCIGVWSICSVHSSSHIYHFSHPRVNLARRGIHSTTCRHDSSNRPLQTT